MGTLLPNTELPTKVHTSHRYPPSPIPQKTNGWHYSEKNERQLRMATLMCAQKFALTQQFEFLNEDTNSQRRKSQFKKQLECATGKYRISTIHWKIHLPRALSWYFKAKTASTHKQRQLVTES